MSKTGLQKEVLKLYRDFLKVIRKKPLDARENFMLVIRKEFKGGSAISKSNFTVIEHLIRNGRKLLEVYKKDECKDIKIKK